MDFFLFCGWIQLDILRWSISSISLHTWRWDKCPSKQSNHLYPCIGSLAYVGIRHPVDIYILLDPRLRRIDRYIDIEYMQEIKLRNAWIANFDISLSCCCHGRFGFATELKHRRKCRCIMYIYASSLYHMCDVLWLYQHIYGQTVFDTCTSSNP